MDDAAPYARLSPDLVIEALENKGLECDGRILPLGSYENRVYQLGVYGLGFAVAKFYRPGRWSDAAIREEHEFSHELAAADVPVVAPMVLDGDTLHEQAGFRFAVFPRRGGRWPELGSREEWVWLGRFLGRMHALGAVRPFAARPRLSVETMGRESVEELLESEWIPEHLVDAYRSVTADLLDGVERIFDEVGPYRERRIHGDCHRGNVLWTDDGPHFVDLDDCMNGPAVQDLWLFLAGGPDEVSVQIGDLLEGYRQFCDFDHRELRLVEPLRTLRMIHYTAWIARRWDDPAFPRAFPWFADARYWETHILSLREQQAVLDESPSVLV